MGIFVGQGISDCCALITAQRLRRIVLRILPAEEAPLPLYNDNDNPELVHLTRNFPNDSYISEVCMCQCQEYSVCSCDQTEASILNDTLTSSSANTTFEEERINVSPATSNIDPIGRLNGQLTSEWSSRPMRNPTSLDASKLPVGSMDNPWAFE
jgi:hypothetical protein